jgi:hypothetical protein
VGLLNLGAGDYLDAESRLLACARISDADAQRSKIVAASNPGNARDEQGRGDNVAWMQPFPAKHALRLG